MMVRGRQKGERGYTLLETVVAMSLFAGAVLPLIAVMGNFMLDPVKDNLQRALIVGEIELTRSIADREFNDKGPWTEGVLIIYRKVTRSDNLVDVTMEIFSSKDTNRALLVLHKSVLDYP